VSGPLHERVARALDEAGDLTGTALFEHIERRHADDGELLAEVRSLLGGAGTVPVLDDAGPAQELARKLQDKLLTSDLFTQGGTPCTREGAVVPVAMPTRVGAYDIVRVIGQGGMGVVYEAMQASPHRRVAIKMLSSAAPTRTALARFRREAELLGRLKHAGIAQVFEAATDAASSAAFFAMEFVDGPPLSTYAQAKQMTLAQRVELIARVCEAIQHAHQAGVIHRDLKPSNILVEAGSDGIGQPKVLDFGVAGLSREAEQSATLALDSGRIIGTLGYMPPEAIDGIGADTRGDIYSLGVLLYELLTGRLPIDVRGTTLAEAARRIREQQAAALEAHVMFGDRAMRADLALIVRKVLAKDAAERYASAAEFAADLRRCLRHEPVLARPTSTWYTLRKFVRRRRGVSALVAGSVLLISGAAVVASVQSIRANAALAREAEQRAIAEGKRVEAERGQYRAAIAAAVAALRTQTPVDARKSLEQAPEHLRGWEWQYLWRMVHPGRAIDLPSPVRTLRTFAHGERVLAEANTSPASTLLWEPETGKVLETLPWRGVSAADDGSFIAGVDAEGQAICRGVDGRVLWRVPAPAGTRWMTVEFVQVTPANPWRVVLCGDFTVKAVDAQGGDVLWVATSEFRNERAGVERTTDPQRPILVGMWQHGPNQERARIDALTGEWIPFNSRLRKAIANVNLGVGFSWALFFRLGEEYPGRPAPTDAVWSQAAITDDASLVAVGDTRGVVSVYTPDPTKQYSFVDAGTLPMGNGLIQDLVLVRGNREVATVDQTGAVRVAPALTPSLPWRTTADRQTRPGPIAPSGAFAVSVGWGFASAVDTLTGLPLWRTNLGRTFPSAAAISTDERHVVWFGDRDGDLNEFFVLDARTGEQVVAWSTSPATIDPRHGFSPAPWASSVRAVSFDPVAARLVVGLTDGSIRVIETNDWTMLDEPRAHHAVEGPRYQSLVHSPDGSMLAVIATLPRDGIQTALPVVLRDAKTLATVATLQVAEPAFTATWSPDGRTLLTGHAQGVVRAWDVATSELLWRSDLGTSDNLNAMAVSPDGERIAAASLGPQMHMLDREGHLVATLPSPVAEVRSLRFTAEQELLATAIRTHIVRFAIDDRERDTWTPAAIAAWPADVSRPASLMQARRMIEAADRLVAHAQNDMMPIADRLRRIREAESADAATKQLAEHWFTRLGPIINWGNSDALVLMRDRRDDPAALGDARDILLELIPRKPHAFNLRSNLAEAYRLLGEKDNAMRSMADAEAALAAMSATFDFSATIGIGTFYLTMGEASHAARVLEVVESHFTGTPDSSLTPAAREELVNLRAGVAKLMGESSLR
jgi:serine/threonine protein kinase